MNKLLFDLDTTLLDYHDILGENKLSILDKNERYGEITDFAVLLGGKYYYSGNRILGSYYVKQELEKSGNIYFVNTVRPDLENMAGVNFFSLPIELDTSERLVLKYSLISKECSNQKDISGIKEVEFGEYPQTVEDASVSNELEKLYNKGKLQKTGKEYTTNYLFDLSTYLLSVPRPFGEMKHIEYEYNRKKYVRILGSYNSKGKKLSDGRRIKNDKPFWVKVEPIVWLVDEEKNKAISKKLLFSGVQFCDKYDHEGDFNSTRIKWFLDTHFSKDIIPSNNKIKYYLVSSNNINFLAYKNDEVLKELYTDINLVPEDASFYPENALIYNYNEIKEITLEEVKNYIKDTKKIDYLKMLRELCNYSNNKILYNSLSTELSKYSNNKSSYNRLSKEYIKEKIEKILSLKL